MRTLLIAGAVGSALVLQACNQAEEPASEAPAETAAAPAAEATPPMAQAPSPDAQTGTFSTTGRITAVTGQSVTVDHQKVEGLGWPAMTMTFQAPDPAMAQGLEAGAPVRFSFQKQGEQYVLTEIRRQ